MNYPCSVSSDIESYLNYDNLLGFGNESLILQESFKEAEDHFFIPFSRQNESPRFKFNKLKLKWVEATKMLSSITEICMHPAYQSIIGMGRTAIPFIVRDMLESYNHWFWALKSITGEDPVPPCNRGKMKKMSVDWFKWWLENKDNL